MRMIILIGSVGCLSGFGLGWMLSADWKGSIEMGQNLRSASKELSDSRSILPDTAREGLDRDLKTKLLSTLADGETEGSFARSLVSQFSASMDPDSVAKQLTEAAWICDPIAMEHAFSLFSEKDPMTAYALAKGLPDRTMRARFLSLAIDIVGRNDYKQGLKLLKESTYENLKPPPFLFTDPVAAAALCQDLSSSLLRNHLLDTLPIAWARTDPKAAVDWTRTQSMSHYQQVCVMKTWAQKDLTSMTEYLMAMPASPNSAWISIRRQ